MCVEDGSAANGMCVEGDSVVAGVTICSVCQRAFDAAPRRHPLHAKRFVCEFCTWRRPRVPL